MDVVDEDHLMVKRPDAVLLPHLALPTSWRRNHEVWDLRLLRDDGLASHVHLGQRLIAILGAPKQIQQDCDLVWKPEVDCQVGHFRRGDRIKAGLGRYPFGCQAQEIFEVDFPRSLNDFSNVAVKYRCNKNQQGAFERLWGHTVEYKFCRKFRTGKASLWYVIVHVAQDAQLLKKLVGTKDICGSFSGHVDFSHGLETQKGGSLWAA